MIFYNRNIIEAGDGYEVIAGRGRKKFIQGVGDDIGIQSFFPLMRCMTEKRR